MGDAEGLRAKQIAAKGAGRIGAPSGVRRARFRRAKNQALSLSPAARVGLGLRVFQPRAKRRAVGLQRRLAIAVDPHRASRVGAPRRPLASLLILMPAMLRIFVRELLLQLWRR